MSKAPKATVARKLEDYAREDFVKTKDALAKKLGLSRVTINSLLNKDGCPQETSRGYCIPKLIDFAKSTVTQNTSTIDKLTGDKTAPVVTDLAVLRSRHMMAQILKIEQQTAIERGEYVSRETLQSKLSSFLVDLDMNFRRQFEQELPQALEGRPAVEIRALLKAAYQEVKQAFVDKHPTLKDS